MNNTLLIGMIVVFALFVGMVAQELNLTGPVITPIAANQEADRRFDVTHYIPVIDELVGTATTFTAYILNAAGSFFQLMTLQADIPQKVYTLVFVPISFVVGFIMWRVIRG